MNRQIKISHWHYFWHYFFWWLLFLPPLSAVYERNSHFLNLTDSEIELEQGWLSKNRTAIAYGNIRSINVQQTWLQRVWFQTGRLSVASAGTEGYEISINGIHEPQQLKELILGQRDSLQQVQKTEPAPRGPSPDNPKLMACPDCGAMVSRRAPACPHCGNPDLHSQSTETTLD